MMESFCNKIVFLFNHIDTRIKNLISSLFTSRQPNNKRDPNITGRDWCLIQSLNHAEWGFCSTFHIPERFAKDYWITLKTFLKHRKLHPNPCSTASVTPTTSDISNNSNIYQIHQTAVDTTWNTSKQRQLKLVYRILYFSLIAWKIAKHVKHM